MIITLKGCTATAFIGGLNFFKVSRGTVSGASVTIATSTINKDEATSTSAREIATVALNSNYENLVVTVTMGGTTVNNWYKNGKVTIPANTTVTGDIKISASATAVVPDVPVTPDEPATPTMYTFTINPTPTTATVTLTASGYSQSDNSISVDSGTTVSWTVSADGYNSRNGSETITGDKTLNISLYEILTGEYWITEQLVDTKVGSGTPTSMLNTQYFYITDEEYLSLLRNKTIKSIAVGTGSKAATGSIILALVPLSDTKPTNWQEVSTIPVDNTDTTKNTVMILDLTETVTVPDGYTIGYRSTKGNIFGGGTVNGTYKRDDYYYNNGTAETSTMISLCPVDFKVEG